MKTFKFLSNALLIIIFSLFSSCKDTNDEPTNPNYEEDKKEDVRYYVKYEIEMKTRWINTINTITFISDNGVQSFEAEGSKNWTATYGPISYGTKVYLKINRNGDEDYTPGETNQARIYISKNQEPFVIKAEDSGNKDIYLSYTIDF